MKFKDERTEQYVPLSQCVKGKVRGKDREGERWWNTSRSMIYCLDRTKLFIINRESDRTESFHMSIVVMKDFFIVRRLGVLCLFVMNR